MSKTAFSGPLIVYGQPPIVGGMMSDYNTNLGPSVFWGGTSFLDIRRGYFPGRPGPVFAFANTGLYNVLDQAPSTISAVNIAAAQVPVAGTALTLVSSTAAGITVGQSVLNPASGQTVSGLLAIDGVPGTVVYNQGNTTAAQASMTPQMYDPTKAIARNIRITSVGNDSSATATVRGYDVYGYPMSETITLANAGIASGKKAFKFIASITPAGTLSGSNVSVGTGDVYGFPILCNNFFYPKIFWNGALITASTGFVVADTTSPATATTGDVRGTYAVQSASDGTKKLQVSIEIPVANLGTVAGVFGPTQFTN